MYYRLKLVSKQTKLHRILFLFKVQCGCKVSSKNHNETPTFEKFQWKEK